MNAIVSMIMNTGKSSFPADEFSVMKKEADRRYHDLCNENKEAPAALKKHTSMIIFPSIAAYEVFVHHGMEEEKAVDLISGFFYGFSKNGFKLVSLRLSLFGGYHRYPANFVKNSMRDFSKESGFEYRLPEIQKEGIARFDIVRCPYHDMCVKYDCLKLNRAFCDSDDAKYSHLHKNLKWERKGTIGKGAECCDFMIADITKK